MYRIIKSIETHGTTRLPKMTILINQNTFAWIVTKQGCSVATLETENQREIIFNSGTIRGAQTKTTIQKLFFFEYNDSPDTLNDILSLYRPFFPNH